MSLEVKQLTKRYKNQKALDAISFKAQSGQVLGFLGPNGAGKSTTMKIASGYLLPDEGDVVINGVSVVEQPKAVSKMIGYLPEHNPLYLDMYVREYLLFNAGIYKIPKNEVENVIEKTGLFSEANKKIGQLSKGYRQRVGLACALLHDPQVLILDEPTTGLDPNQLIEIRSLIKNVGKEKTVLLSTHIMQEVEAICDRVIIINKGEIVLDKKMEALKNSKQQIIEVEFDYRVETIALQQLPKIEKIENSVGFVYQLYFDTTVDMRGKVFDFAHDNGLKILQLHNKNTTLEKLFGELTSTS